MQTATQTQWVHELSEGPRETRDQPGVGRLVRMGAWLGGGIDCVSCSPDHVPVARFAAAQAAIRAA